MNFEELKNKLIDIAERRTFYDSKRYREESASDCLGHGDDCYDRGLDDGETALAREILQEFFDISIRIDEDE